MVHLLARDFHVRNMSEARELRRRLETFGRAVQQAAQETPAAPWIRGHYVTRYNDPRHEWVAWLKAADRESQEMTLTALAHPHLVLPQDSGDPWLGINVEFIMPRSVLLDVLASHADQVVAAVRELPEAEARCVVKRVHRNDSRKYFWENNLWPQWRPVSSQGFSVAEAALLRSILAVDVAAPSVVDEYIAEPAIVFGWKLPEELLLEWGDALTAELVRRIACTGPLLRLLAGD